MTTPGPVVISGAVEGLIDEAVVCRLILDAGATPGAIYGRRGKAHLKENIRRYNAAAQHHAWLVLVDLDHDAACAPSLRTGWLPSLAPNMCFRIAVRAVETWLLADRQGLAQFLSIPVSRIPDDPEAVDDPKLLMMSLAQRSRKREIREDMVPEPKSGRKVGPAYTSRLMQFVADKTSGWRPEAASVASESLRRCLRCLYQLVDAVSRRR
jgi:hypothetical protein